MVSPSSSHGRAERLRSLLRRSEALYAGTLDGALARCASTLERAAEIVEPTVTKTKALGAAREEVRSALATAEKVLEHLDAARRFEGVVLDGPQGDNLDAFVMALERLDEASSFLSRHKNGLVAAAAAAESVDALRKDGNVLALREFESTLREVGGQQQRAPAAEAKKGGKTTAEEQQARQRRRRLRLLGDALGRNEAATPSCVKTYLDSRKTVADAATASEETERKQQTQQQQDSGGALVESRRRGRRWYNLFGDERK